MCSEHAGTVDLALEYGFDEAMPFGLDGYRADCRHYPFSEVILIDHVDRYLDQLLITLSAFPKRQLPQREP